jgi:hypothetical protein
LIFIIACLKTVTTALLLQLALWYMKTDYQEIIENVTAIFTSCDNLNWQQLKDALADRVLLDYASLSGNPAALLNAELIVNAWKAIFPGFQNTHHQVGNFVVEQEGSTATVYCYGTATHYLPNDSNNDLWTVVGTYNFHCTKINGKWKVDQMKFNFKYQDGNTDIPRMAAEKAKQKSSDN